MKKMLTLALTSAFLPLTSFADITLTNNTSSPMTGKTSLSPCSSIAGDNGIVKPHGGTITVPSAIVNTFCAFGCTVKLYASASCSGSEIASGEVNLQHKISSVSNHNSQGYVATGSGEYGEIHGGPTRKWYDVFKIFG